MAKKSFIEYLLDPDGDAVSLAAALKEAIGIGAAFDADVAQVEADRIIVENITALFGDVNAAIAGATTQKDLAVIQANLATAQAALAAAARVAAQSAQTAAELARDGALAGGTIYPDIATGRAAVADNAYFKVVGSGDVSFRLYQRNSALTETLVIEQPSTARFGEFRALDGYEQSGYLLAFVNNALSLFAGVRESDNAFWALRLEADVLNLIKMNYRGTEVTVLDSVEYQQCGFVTATVDSSFNIIDGITDEAVPNRYSGTNLRATVSDFHDYPNWALYVETINGLKQVFSWEKATGTIRQLSTQGNNVLPSIDASGTKAIWSSDRIQKYPTKGMWSRKLDASDVERPVFAKKELTAYMDSLGAGVGATNATLTGVMALTAAGTGMPLRQRSIGGQKTSQIFRRFGALPTSLTVTGNAIPASGTVAVTHLNGVAVVGSNTSQYPDYRLLSTAADNNGRSLDIVIPGVGACTLTRSASGVPPSTTETMLVARKAPAAGATAILADQPFTVDVGNDDECVVVLGGPTNDGPANLAAARANIDAAAAYCKSIKQAFIIVLPHNQAIPSQYVGQPDAIAYDAYRTSMKAAYPGRCVDWQQRLLASNDGSVGDLADIANGVCPRSKRASGGADTIHLNDVGQTDVSVPMIATVALQIAY